MKKAICMLMAVLLSLAVSACGQDTTPAEDSFTVQVLCESKGIYQLFYSCYLGDAQYSSGAMADLDGNEITADTDLTLVFSRSFFEESDLSRFAMDFSPYGKDDVSEIATTERVSFAAEYGKTYTIVFSGDREQGFQATLKA